VAGSHENSNTDSSTTRLLLANGSAPAGQSLALPDPTKVAALRYREMNGLLSLVCAPAVRLQKAWRLT
jgi:hypothetical protein